MKRDAEVVNDTREDGENAKALASEEKEKLTKPREQVNDLQIKLSEKEGVLKSLERNQVKEIQEKLEETKRLVIRHKERQAALEKTQWGSKDNRN
ncbi:hypothetical protein Bca52824_021578 [Brassica carinata]|uniref:Uncharacterized protein n=1 Tax=Brassica carinata TaxID=52824 RepID=A0A8X7VEW7_BRACI|nr:hypothetical protein Bca52824_021578 [Brassica carinata]